MLSAKENELLTRVGPGTPMGDVFRRYWLPAALSEELPEADGAPVRVRLLGEDLLAFRDTMGKVGLVSAFCPHRRAPLFFGRNEECGIRCVYHGWKFDRDGRCVDMPSEPPGFTFQDEGNAGGVSDARSRGHDLGVSGSAGSDAAAAGLRITARAGRLTSRIEDVSRMQLLAGARGRPRLGALYDSP